MKPEQQHSVHRYFEDEVESLDKLFKSRLNSFLAGCNFCHLLITFANRLDPDKDRQNVGSDINSNCLTL